MFVHNAAKPYPSFAASPYGLQTRARRTLFFEEDECCYDGGSGGNKSLDVDAPEMLQILEVPMREPISINLTC